MEAIHLHDAAALTAFTNPELFEIEPVGCDVETAGELTTGELVVDRRPNPSMRGNAHLATSVDAAAVADCIIRGLKTAGLA